MPYSYRLAPENARADDNSIKDIVRVVNNMMNGKTNNVREVTLLAGSALTVVEDPLVAGESFVDVMPLTANAAAAKQSLYFSDFGKGTFTIRHPNNSQIDRTYRYVVVA